MGKYFDRFPKVFYSLADDRLNPEIVTDITFSVRLLESYAQDTSYYYKVIVKDGLKPEDVAYLVYGDPELHWLVLQFNKMVNPRFDWPMSSINLDKYIADKYGSIQNAQTTIHTYYKVVTYVSSTSDTPSVYNIEIGADEYAALTLDLAGTTYPLAGGESVTIKIDRSTLSNYDWEVAMNEQKREISLLQKQYVDAVKSSFNSLVKNS